MANPDLGEKVKVQWRSLDNRPDRERYVWEDYLGEDRLGEREAKAAASGLLTPTFLTETLRLMGNPNPEVPSAAQITMIQMGHKDNVYLVTTPPEQPSQSFILIQSKGSPSLNRELEQDFKDLIDLRTALAKNRLPVFVPKLFVLSEANGVPGFSYQYLPDHDEIGADPACPVPNTPYLEPIANSYSDTSKHFNHDVLWKQVGALPNFCFPHFAISSEVLKASDYYKTSEGFKSEMITRLYLVYRAMGEHLPKSFSIKAGDLMADFRKFLGDFDIQLITVRGGFKRIDGSFEEWAASLRETVYMGTPTKYKVPFFADMNTIDQGVIKGQNILSQA